MSSHEQEQLTDKRNRRILHEVQLASRRSIDMLVEAYRSRASFFALDPPPECDSHR